MISIDVNDDALLAAHEQLETDSLEETVEESLSLVAELENAEELVTVEKEQPKSEVPV